MSEYCNLCPRNCNADRLNDVKGYCNSDLLYNIGSVCIHRGEEPIISGRQGICNVFFTKCNLQCVYCQNKQISSNYNSEVEYKLELAQIVKIITDILDRDVKALGFVSPSHNSLQVKQIINEIRSRGYNPITIYNSNGYDKVETLRSLEGYIDIYLPDYKYADASLGKKLSGVSNYPDTALAAIKEMSRQKGSSLHTDEDGQAISGLIIRHLVLPGYIENSLNVLQLIADEISTNVHISLMSQYNPVHNTSDDENLCRSLTSIEYQKVVDKFEELGFYKGWIQDLESAGHYNPDFTINHPFEF